MKIRAGVSVKQRGSLADYIWEVSKLCITYWGSSSSDYAMFLQTVMDLSILDCRGQTARV